jgi:hypothetical protein
VFLTNTSLVFKCFIVHCTFKGTFPLTIPYVALRGISTTSTKAAAAARTQNRLHVRVGRFKPSKDKSIALTYNESKAPYKIGLEKSWNSWNTSKLVA